MASQENKANKQPSAWIEIPLVEGLESISSSIVCSNLDSGLSIVRFLIYPKDESTKAHLSAHQSIAVLPVGFRPPRFDWCFLTTVDFTPAVLPIYIKGNTGIVLTHSDVDFWISEEHLSFVLFNLYQENKANLGIPTEYDLPLMDGITSHYKPRYWRDGCNNVGIAGLILFDEHPIFEQKIAMLPVGYRPITSRQFALAMAVPPHTSIYGWIEVNGTIRLASVNYSEDVKRNSSFAFIVPPFYAAF